MLIRTSKWRWGHSRKHYAAADANRIFVYDTKQKDEPTATVRGRLLNLE